MKRRDWRQVILPTVLTMAFITAMVPTALNPYPEPIAPNGQKIVWRVNPQTKKAEPTLEACPAPVQVWGGWFGWLDSWFFGSSPRCTGGGFAGGGGGAF